MSNTWPFAGLAPPVDGVAKPIRDGDKAFEAARMAHALSKGPAEMAALAAAHAELGQFDKAVEWQEKAVAAAPAGAKEPYRERLKKYQDRKPYRLE